MSILLSGRIKSLLDRLTSARAANLDEITPTRLARLNADMTSRLASNDARLNNLDAPISGITVSVLASNVQRGSTGILLGTTSATVAISAVNLNKSMLIFSVDSSGTEARDGLVSGRFTSTTELRFQRSGNGGACSIYWQVIEYS